MRASAGIASLPEPNHEVRHTLVGCFINHLPADHSALWRHLDYNSLTLGPAAQSDFGSRPPGSFVKRRVGGHVAFGYFVGDNLISAGLLNADGKFSLRVRFAASLVTNVEAARDFQQRAHVPASEKSPRVVSQFTANRIRRLCHRRSG